MASVLDDMEKAMRLLKDRGAEMAALEGTLEQINASLADIVALMEKTEDPAKEAAQATAQAQALGAALSSAIAKLPAPKVEMAAPVVTVNTGKAGDKWRIESTRPDGSTMTMLVTRL